MAFDGSADSLLKRIVSDIEADISSRRLKPGAKLPSEKALCDAYKANRFVVRRALRKLETEGRVEAVQGRGRYVRYKPVEMKLEPRMELPTPTNDDHGVYHTSMLNLSERAPDKAVFEALRLAYDDRVLKVERLFFLDDVPMGRVDQYLIRSHVPEFGRMLDACGGSVSTALSQYGVTMLDRISAHLGARAPEPGECEMLGVPNHVPLVQLRQVFADQNGPFQYLIMHAPSDRMELRIEH